MEMWKLPEDERIVSMVTYAPGDPIERVFVATTLGVYEIVGNEMRPLKFVIPDES